MSPTTPFPPVGSTLFMSCEFGLPVNGAHMVAPHLLLAYLQELRILDAKPVRQPIGGGSSFAGHKFYNSQMMSNINAYDMTHDS